MTTTNPTAEHAAARAFNDAHPIGTPVRYWKGFREGDGKVSRTRTNAQLLSGHTAVVWLEGVSGCIALTHVEPISEEEFAAAPGESRATARPLPLHGDNTESGSPVDWKVIADNRERELRREGEGRYAQQQRAEKAEQELATARAEVARLATQLAATQNDLRSQTAANTAYANEVAELRKIVEAAKQWGEHYGNTSNEYHNAATALFAALNALPNEQKPRPGQFCAKHFSWLCQAGQGRCQAETAEVAAR